MFGYLQVDKAELKVREWEAYKSVYCGLCRQMGRDYSFLSRLARSYDCTYYAMLLMSVHRSCTGFDSGRCRFNPLKKCGFARCTDESYSKAAALSVISVYYKLLDDIRDSGFFKRLGTRFLKLFFYLPLTWEKQHSVIFIPAFLMNNKLVHNGSELLSDTLSVFCRTECSDIMPSLYKGVHLLTEQQCSVIKGTQV